MAADYDAPRTTGTDDDTTESIEAFKERAPQTIGLAADLDDGDTAGPDLDVVDLDTDTLDVVVLPVQEDEFTCTECFLVRPRTQYDHDGTHGPVFSWEYAAL